MKKNIVKFMMFVFLLISISVPSNSFADHVHANDINNMNSMTNIDELKNAYKVANDKALKNLHIAGYGIGEERIGNTIVYVRIVENKKNIPSMLRANSNVKYIEYTKTVGAKNPLGAVNWQIDLTGGFSYDGKTVTATRSSIDTKAGWFFDTSDINHNHGTINSKLAYASGSAHFKLQFGVGDIGITTKDFTESVTIHCDENGNAE